MPFRLIEPALQLSRKAGELNEKVDDLTAAVLVVAEILAKDYETHHGGKSDVIGLFAEYRELLKNRK